MFVEVTFEMGDLMSDALTFEIGDDNINELTEDFTAVLSSPSIGLSLGNTSTATVEIVDDDG